MDHVRTGHVCDHACRGGRGHSPKDTALARIIEEAVLAVDEDAHDLSMPE